MRAPRTRQEREERSDTNAHFLSPCRRTWIACKLFHRCRCLRHPRSARPRSSASGRCTRSCASTSRCRRRRNHGRRVEPETGHDAATTRRHTSRSRCRPCSTRRPCRRDERRRRRSPRQRRERPRDCGRVPNAARATRPWRASAPNAAIPTGAAASAASSTPTTSTSARSAPAHATSRRPSPLRRHRHLRHGRTRRRNSSRGCLHIVGRRPFIASSSTRPTR